MLKTIFFATKQSEELLNHLKTSFPDAELVRGYINGESASPSFDEVNIGISKHAFALKVRFDDDEYDLKAFFGSYLNFIENNQINIFDFNRPYQYRLGIYYIDMLDGIEANMFLNETLNKKSSIEIKMMRNFYEAK